MLFSLPAFCGENFWVHRAELNAAADEISRHWLTRNWYYNQTMLGTKHPWFALQTGKLSKNGENAFDYSSWKFTTAYGVSLPRVSFGGAFFFNEGHFSSATGDDIFTKGKGLGLYISYTPKPWYLAGSFVADFSENYYLDDRYDGEGASIRVEAGKRYNISRNGRLTPYFTMSHTSLTEPLPSKSKWNFTELSPGVRLEGSIPAPWGRLGGNLDMKWVQILGSQTPGSANGGHEGFKLAAGFDIQEFYATLNLGIDYLFEIRKGQKNHAVSFALDLRF